MYSRIHIAEGPCGCRRVRERLQKVAAGHPKNIQLAAASHILRSCTALSFQKLPALRFDAVASFLKTHGMPRNKIPVDPSFTSKDLEHTIQKRQITARIDWKPRIRELRPEKCGFRNRGNPVPLKARLEKRIDYCHLGARFARVKQIF